MCEVEKGGSTGEVASRRVSMEEGEGILWDRKLSWWYQFMYMDREDLH